MNKLISRRSHGLLDYTNATIIAHLPEVVGFHRNRKATQFFRTLSGVLTAYTVATRAEWGAVKLMSYKKHLIADLVVSAAAVTAPWTLGFSKNKKATLASIVVGCAGLTLVALSEPENMPVTKDAFEETREKLLPS